MFSDSFIPNPAFRRFHQSLLRKAVKAIEEQPVEERMSASEVFSMDGAGLDQARKLANEFLDQLHELSERSAKKDRVYAVTLNLFKILGR